MVLGKRYWRPRRSEIQFHHVGRSKGMEYVTSQTPNGLRRLRRARRLNDQLQIGPD